MKTQEMVTSQKKINTYRDINVMVVPVIVIVLTNITIIIAVIHRILLHTQLLLTYTYQTKSYKLYFHTYRPKPSQENVRTYYLHQFILVTINGNIYLKHTLI